MKEGDDNAMDEEVTLNQENEQQPEKDEQEVQEKQNEQEQQQDQEIVQPSGEPTLEEMIKNEKKTIRERIQKAKAIVKPVEGKNFNTRQDINFEDEELTLRPEVLHVYGVDFLSTQDIMNYFDRFEPTKIEWLNDSSCNVVFKNEEVVENAVKALALTIQDAELSEEWKKGLPYKEKNIEFSLYFRLATSKDVKGQAVSGKESQYYKYMRQRMQGQRESRQNKSNYSDRYSKVKSNNNNNRLDRDSRGGNRYNDSQTRNRNNNRYDKSDNRNNNKNSNKRKYDDSDDEGDNKEKEIGQGEIADKENDQEKQHKSPVENRSDEKNGKESPSEKERERERSRSQKRKQSSDSDEDDDLR